MEREGVLGALVRGSVVFAELPSPFQEEAQSYNTHGCPMPSPSGGGQPPREDVHVRSLVVEGLSLCREGVLGAPERSSTGISVEDVVSCHHG